jgi:pyridoxine 5'-phosphate synthase PdxJ
MAYLNTHVSKVSAVSETLRLILKTTGRHISKEDNIKINGNTAIYVVFTDAVTSIMLINMIKEEPHLATIVPSLSNTTLLL